MTVKKATPKNLKKKKQKIRNRAKWKVVKRMTMQLNELEAIYMDGSADEVSGNVEAPMGHFYRIGSQIVTTDSQGFLSVESFLSEAHAKAEFESRAEEYAEWDE